MNKKIETALFRSVGQLAVLSFERIADAPVTRLQAHDDVTRQQPVRGKALPWPKLTAMAACAAALVVAFTGWFTQYRMVDCTVGIDVNPSFEMTMSRREQVLEVRGLNAEAQAILEGRQYKGWSAEAAMQALCADLVAGGFVSVDSPTLLLSVNGRDADRTRQIKTTLTDQIVQSLGETGISPDVLQQDVVASDDLRQDAEQHHITQGKMQLIRSLLAQRPNLSAEALAGMNLTQLWQLAQQSGLEVEVGHQSCSHSQQSGSGDETPRNYAQNHHGNNNGGHNGHWPH